DEAPDSRRPRGLHHPVGEVRMNLLEGLRSRLADDAHQVDHRIVPARRLRERAGRFHVGEMKLGARLELPPPAGAGEHAYAMAPGEQFTSHRRTDESRAAREKDLHAGTLAEAFPRAIVRSARQGGGSRLAWLRIGARCLKNR